MATAEGGAVLQKADNTADNVLPKRKMGRPCQTCSHPQKAEIERILMAREITQEEVSVRYGIPHSSLARHYANHLPLATRGDAALAVAEAEGTRGATLLEQAEELALTMRKAMDDALCKGERGDAIKACREVSRLLEVQAKLMGQISDAPQISIAMDPGFVQVRMAIMSALAPHPEARRDVVAALGRLSGRSEPLTIEHRT